MSLSPTRQDLTQGHFVVGVYGEVGQEEAETRALPEFRWSSVHVMRCEPDEPDSLDILRETGACALNRTQKSSGMLRY